VTTDGEWDCLQPLTFSCGGHDFDVAFTPGDRDLRDNNLTSLEVNAFDQNTALKMLYVDPEEGR
jgi:hypothetical protein